MIMGFCFLLPPILLMYLRDKILGGNGCSFRKDAFSFVREYLITALLLNFAVISIAYIVFGHTEMCIRDRARRVPAAPLRLSCTDFAAHCRQFLCWRRT